ncbi:hypothetical protein ES703_74779 [subsurface metagenome]
MVGTTEKGFSGGKLVVTSGVSDRMSEDPDFYRMVNNSISRHFRCDWGDLSAEDKAENDLAVKEGDLRILSAYEHQTLPKIWIITEADRSSTAVLFPDEY